MENPDKQDASNKERMIGRAAELQIQNTFNELMEMGVVDNVDNSTLLHM